MQHAGLYLWPRRFRHVGLILALIASLFWLQKLSSDIDLLQDNIGDPKTTIRIIERDLAALDIAHHGGGILKWYLAYDERKHTLNLYLSELNEISYMGSEAHELQDQVKLRLAEAWPEEIDRSYMMHLLIANSFYLFCMLSALILTIHFYLKRNLPISAPPLPSFSVGWVLMIFFLADLFNNSLTTKIYQLLIDHQISFPSVYYITTGISQAMVPFLICALSFARWKHFRKKFFPDFTIHWKYIFFTLGVTNLADLLLRSFLPPSDQILPFYFLEDTSGFIIFTIISVIILAPIFEEITFRGFLFQGLRHKFGFYLSAIFSSILFACVHVQYDWLNMLLVGIGGYAGCWVTHRTGSLTSGIIMHALHNLYCLVSFYFYYMHPL